MINAKHFVLLFSILIYLFFMAVSSSPKFFQSYFASVCLNSVIVIMPFTFSLITYRITKSEDSHSYIICHTHLKRHFGVKAYVFK